MQIERVVIIGAGAVGGCIGGFLARNNFPTVLVARGKHGQTIRSHGLLIKRPVQSFTVNPDCVESIDAVDWRSGDIAIVATKLNDAESALDLLLQSAGDSVPVVCATNGIHAEKWATQRFQFVISMMIWMPTTFLIEGEVEVYGGDCPGVLDCGAVNQTNEESNRLARELCQLLNSAGFNSAYRHNISCWKNAKLITNLANTAQALVSDDWKSVAKAAQQEGKQVMDRAGMPHATKEELQQRAQLVNLLPIDGKHRPGGSTWQSLQRNRPLESPWLEGAIVELAEQAGCSAPINQRLSEAAKTLQKLAAAEVLGAV